jgi:ABC-type sulfate/molybdate transport systems ATPase subunit
MHKKPAELSQGMRQRVGIARAFALKPRMLLLDEPFGMLDSLTRYELQTVLLDLWRKNSITALMVTHDVDEALYLSDRVVCMTDGPEAEVGDIIPVHFARPRERRAVLEHPDYYSLRERLMEFLEIHAHRRKPWGTSLTTAAPPQFAARAAMTGSTPDAVKLSETSRHVPSIADLAPAGTSLHSRVAGSLRALADANPKS